MTRKVPYVAVLFLVVAIALGALEHFATEPNWLAVLLIYFGPGFFVLTAAAVVITVSRRNRRAAFVWSLGLLAWFPAVNGLMNIDFGPVSGARDHFAVLSYNVRVFNTYAHLNTNQRETLELIDFVVQHDADIKCLQEYANHPIKEMQSRSSRQAAAIFEQTGANLVVAPLFVNGGGGEFGLAVLSRFPIIDHGVLDMPVQQPGNGVMWVDVDIHGKIVRVFNAHIGSLGLSDRISAVAGFDEIRVNLRSLGPYMATKVKQARVLVDAIDSATVPIIMCGDLNDPPFGYLARQLQSRLVDAFSQHQWGTIGTIRSDWLSWLRVDYVFSSEELRAEDAQVMTGIDLSDHYPVVVQFGLN